MTGTALDRIVAGVREDLAARKRALPESALAELAAETPAPSSLAAALRSSGPGRGRPRVIAEFKRASPSRGRISPPGADPDPARVALAYRDAGAAAVSVLTETRSFAGSPEDLARAAAALAGAIPILRKDFILEPYQIVEARALGASAVLLLAALHDLAALRALLANARANGLEALVEVHDEAELERAAAAGASIVGVNNRDLRTLAVTLETSVRLAPLLPPAAVKVSESGIGSRKDMDRLAAVGYDAVLVGERLMSENEPGEALGRLLA